MKINIWKAFSVLSLLFAFSVSATNETERECFDDVIKHQKMLGEKTQLISFSVLMDLLKDPSVAKAYKKLLKQSPFGGNPRLFVEILPPQNEGEGNTLRFTFEVWKRVEFQREILVATLVVDKYSVPDGRMDAPFPVHYRVGAVQVVSNDDL